jgi:replication-associated recombination protein RarA
MQSIQSLVEKYRPRSFDEMTGNPKAVALLRRIADQGVGGRAVWISGPSGVGKTTAARILATGIADRFCIIEIDAGSLTADRLREWQDQAELYGWGKGGRAFIVNEAHGLRADIIRRLLVWIERGNLPGHVAVIFTTTRAGEDKLFDEQIDASPLLSRCSVITFSNQGLAQPFAEMARRIALAEQLDGQGEAAYLKLARECKGNARAMIQRIEDGCMTTGGAE